MSTSDSFQCNIGPAWGRGDFRIGTLYNKVICTQILVRQSSVDSRVSVPPENSGAKGFRPRGLGHSVVDGLVFTACRMRGVWVGSRCSASMPACGKVDTLKTWPP